MKYAAININFDSLGEAYGFPLNYRDPSFFEVSERFFEISTKFDFKYSIFVIGKDVIKPENFERVKEWSLQKHEIGNHTWSHPLNFGTMKKSSIYQEVELAHKIITKATGKEPKGFIAPNWNTSPNLIKVLIDLNYSYDTSTFPSWVMMPMLMKLLYNHIGSNKLTKIIKRKDSLLNLFGPRNIYYANNSLFNRYNPTRKTIKIMPIPTNKLRIACWHTLVFILGWKLYKKLLKSCLEKTDAFYYLVHPADLMDKEDLDPRRKIFEERMGASLKKKKEYLEKSIKLILDSGRKIVTMDELAEKTIIKRRK